MMKKYVLIAASLILICLVLVVAANWSLVQQIAVFHPIILPNFGPAPADEAEARLQDIEYLANLVDYDRSFNDQEREMFEELMANGRAQAADMSLAELYLLAARAAALADNGHTNVHLTPLQRDFNAVGLRYFLFRDGLYIVRALKEYEQLIGARVIEIDGQPITSILNEMQSYFGGKESWRQLYAVRMLESADILHAAGLAESPDGYTLTVQSQQGEVQQVQLAARTPAAEDKPGRSFLETLAAEALADEGDVWVHALQEFDDDLLPPFFQEMDQLYFWTPLPNEGGYFRLKNTVNDEQQTLAEFYQETIEPLPEGSLRYLVVDLRLNDAGDLTLFADIAGRLPAKVADNGHLYIVVGPQTFSGGLIPVAMLKYHGGDKALIVGSPMGDREQYWAERGMLFQLPHAGFTVSYATGYHDWAAGCEDHPYCFTQVLKHGVKAGSLEPTHVIEAEYADYAAGKDVVLDWIAEQEGPGS